MESNKFPKLPSWLSQNDNCNNSKKSFTINQIWTWLVHVFYTEIWLKITKTKRSGNQVAVPSRLQIEGRNNNHDQPWQPTTNFVDWPNTYLMSNNVYIYSVFCLILLLPFVPCLWNQTCIYYHCKHYLIIIMYLLHCSKHVS